MEAGREITEIDPASQRLRIVPTDGHRYVFPAGQYRFEPTSDSLWTCAGWGEQYGGFGLIGVGFYSVRLGPCTIIELEQIDAVRSAILTGIISGATIVTYLGIRNLSASSDKGGGGGRPPEVN
jgi:hypothetical protein